jgi:hypothetical protein
MAPGNDDDEDNGTNNRQSSNPIASEHSIDRQRVSTSSIKEGKPAKRNRSNDEDPFPSSQRCRPVDDTDTLKVLWWHSPDPFVPLATEEAMLPNLMRWKGTEKGMMKNQPVFRLAPIQILCRQQNVPLLTALSLRRHHIKRYHPNRSMSSLQLGKEDDIKQSAALFEQAVERALREFHKVSLWSESEQKAHIRQNRKEGEPYPPTPDFILQQPLLVKKHIEKKHRRVIDEEIISCKLGNHMFVLPSRRRRLPHGASLSFDLQQGSKSKCFMVLLPLSSMERVLSGAC